MSCGILVAERAAVLSRPDVINRKPGGAGPPGNATARWSEP